MMTKSGTGEARHLDLVGAGTVQNHLFLERVRQEIPVTLHTVLSEALSMVGLRGDGISVLLIDASYLPLDAVIDELSAVKLHDNVCPALLNLDRAAAHAADSIACGIRGMFYRDDDIDLVLRGVRALFEGSVWISRETLFDAVRNGDHHHHHHDRTGEAKQRNPADELTRREREIVGLICIGATNQEIADKLFISTNTVKTHIYKIYKKIHVPNRMQAALWGAKNL